MIETVITVLSALSNVKTIYDGAQAVSTFVATKAEELKKRELSQGVVSFGDEELAIENTFKEWEHLILKISPKIQDSFERYNPKDVHSKAMLLSELCEKYRHLSSDLDLLKIRDEELKHTALSVAPNNDIKVFLGTSEETSSLKGVGIYVDSFNHRITKFKGEIMGKLPVFKITMLGDSGVGKTVFMAFMSTALCARKYDLSISASEDQDRELQGMVEDIYEYNNFPLGTLGTEYKYEFDLLLKEKPIARIDWVDYRGGAMTSAASEDDTKFLLKRLRESDAIIAMFSLNDFKINDLGSVFARTRTKLTRMTSLISRAMTDGGKIKSVLFVRTQTDRMIDDIGTLKLKTACEEIKVHVGKSSKIGGVPYTAGIPVSSARIKGENENKVFEESEPINVEWVLFLALAFLLQDKLSQIDKLKYRAEERITKIQPGAIKSIFKDVFNIGPSQIQVDAQNQLDEISRTLIGIRGVIKQILEQIPKEQITFFDNDIK